MSEEDFIALLTVGQPAAPAYFTSDAAMNKRVHQEVADKLEASIAALTA